MEKLLGKNIEELQEVALAVGLKKFAAKQMADWLYQKRVTQIDEMTNLSKAAREQLKAGYCVGCEAPVQVAESQDGTKKYLFKVETDRGSYFIESVYIPDGDRATLCVSTQAGCKMGCRFCTTGAQGFHGQLTAADILNQIFSIPETKQLTNLVYMGMGEPMDNLQPVLRSLDVMTKDWGCAWSPHRITVSSVGVLPGLRVFLEQSQCQLAISLHNPFAQERQEMMPIQQTYALSEVLRLVKRYDFKHQRRLSFEYIVFGGKNDTMRHAQELRRQLSGLSCHVNLIRFHEGDQAAEFPATNMEKMEWLRDFLNDNGITTTIRKSRGEDIWAACGMLAGTSI